MKIAAERAKRGGFSTPEPGRRVLWLRVCGRCVVLPFFRYCRVVVSAIRILLFYPFPSPSLALPLPGRGTTAAWGPGGAAAADGVELGRGMGMGWP